MQPVGEIGKIAPRAEIYFHTDAVQAAGKVPLDVKEIGCDLLTISGHKIHGPQGVGALFVRKGTLLQPLLYGGSHERSRRAGTENLAGNCWAWEGGRVGSRGLATATASNGNAARPFGKQIRLTSVEPRE